MAKKNDITFDDFWTAYALKRDRVRAERAWNRLPAKDRRAAYAGIDAYREQCQQSGIHMMYAQGYLNNRRWEDEPLTQVSGSKCQVPGFGTPETSGDCSAPPCDMEIW